MDHPLTSPHSALGFVMFTWSTVIAPVLLRWLTQIGSPAKT
jgi:hypothetical protein